jgi:hypothetical protein
MNELLDSPALSLPDDDWTGPAGAADADAALYL